jgi:hypothetical protein
MKTLDLELLIDNSIKGFDAISRQLLGGDNITKMKDRDEIYLSDNSLMNEDDDYSNSSISPELFNDSYNTNIQLSEKDWSQLINLFEIKSGSSDIIIPKVYNNVPYYEMIYNPGKYNNIPSRSDIELFNVVGGNIDLFNSISSTSPETTNIIAGSSNMKEDDINNIESFFEIYDSNSSLLTGKVEDINRWKDINNYDEFLQRPLLKEGKEFMSKFLDIQTRIYGGEIIPRQEIETLIPSYMKQGEFLMSSHGEVSDIEVLGGRSLDLTNAVDPSYSESSYLLSNSTPEITKDLLHAAFMRTFMNLRTGTLGDLKKMIANIREVVNQINKITKQVMVLPNPIKKT